MSETVFLMGLAIAATTVIVVAKAIAGAFAGRGPSQGEVAQLREQVDQQTAILEDAQAALAQQSAQLAELQERLDFTERLLTQARDRPALGPGERG
jgi:Tfp pilus assembly protein FimV